MRNEDEIVTKLNEHKELLQEARKELAELLQDEEGNRDNLLSVERRVNQNQGLIQGLEWCLNG